MRAGQQQQLALSLFTDTNNSKPDGSKTGTANRKGSVRNRRGRERDPLLDHPAVQLYREIVRLSLNSVQRGQVANAVGDSPASLSLYREVLVQFMSEGQPRQRADWTVERFQKAEQLTSERFTAAESSSVFSPQSIREHVTKCRQLLAQLAQWRSSQNKDELCDAMTAAAAQLLEIENGIVDDAPIDVRQVEDKLTAIDKSVCEAIVPVVLAKDLDAAEAAAHERLRQYRAQMDSAAYAESFQRLVLKQLREQFELPRLSLYA